MSVTTEELYEQAKRILRATLPEEVVGDSPFVLACHECGLAFRNDVELGMVADHVRTHGVDPEAGEMTLDLVYIGEGPPPESAR